MTLIASVSLPQGLVREELVSASDRIAQAFSALRASVHGQQISALQLHLEFVDALGQTFTTPLATAGGTAHSRGRFVEQRQSIARLGASHGPRPADPRGHGSGMGIDRRGGMELAMGRALLTRFADDAPLAVALLEDAVASMQIERENWQAIPASTPRALTVRWSSS